MIKTPFIPDPEQFPEHFRPLLRAPVYDSSCSQAAKVIFIDRDGGLYLKRSGKGQLQKEAEMTRFFHSKGLSPEVLAYESLDNDWLLTKAAAGKDCTDDQYLSDPRQLSALLGELLRQLHSTQATGCPVHRTKDFQTLAAKNYAAGHYDTSLFPDNWGYRSAEEAWRVVEEYGQYLRADTLLHGDYCLPNILLDHWQFSAFIDLDTAGLGDRHIDLFWGMWTLQFNLKTDVWRDRFLDAYGRNDIHEEMLRVISAFEVFL